MVRTLGHDHEPVVSDADPGREDGLGRGRGRDDDEGGPGSGPGQSRLVPAPAPGRKSLRHLSPGHVVHSRHERYGPGGGRRGERDGVDEVAPSPHPRQAQVPGPGHEGPGEGRACERVSQAGEEVTARGRAAGDDGDRGTLVEGELADALQQARV